MQDQPTLNYESGKGLNYKRELHIAAILTAACTFPLIFMGGLVTSKGAGLAVPDWPNSFGYNMFLFPPSQWVGGVFYEHTHRLLGSLVGLLAIVMTVIAWRREPRRWVRWLATGSLGLVIVQGVLGGLRVIWVNLDLAIVHACVAQAFFCFAALLVAVTSKWWAAYQADATPVTPVASRARIAKLAMIAAILIYLQLVVGAVMRHYQAGLAIPDLPFAYGQLVPPVTDGGLARINNERMYAYHLEPVSLMQVWVHFGHRVGAVVVTIAVLYLAGAAIKWHRESPLLARPARQLSSLIVIQVALGVMTVLWKKPADIATAHVAVGALTLFVTFTLAVRAMRLSQGQRVLAAETRSTPLPMPQPSA